jgi:(2Fe-2S) ferredoxin
MSVDSTHPLATKRLVIGHLTVCQGCCCGNTENGRPPVPVEWLKKEWRSRGLLKRVQLTISGCLGPCDVPNVVTISNESGTQWFGEITEFEQYRDLLDWLAGPETQASCCLFRKNFSAILCIRFASKRGNCARVGNCC